MNVIVFATGPVGCAVVGLAEGVDASEEVGNAVPIGAAYVIVDKSTLPASDPIGWKIESSAIVETGAVSIPQQVPMWAAQAALQAAGKYDVINKAIVGDPTANPPVPSMERTANSAIFYAWTMGNFASRSSAFIATLASQFGMASADIDAVFVAAGRIAAVAG